MRPEGKESSDDGTVGDNKKREKQSSEAAWRVTRAPLWDPAKDWGGSCRNMNFHLYYHHYSINAIECFLIIVFKNRRLILSELKPSYCSFVIWKRRKLTIYVLNVRHKFKHHENQCS